MQKSAEYSTEICTRCCLFDRSHNAEDKSTVMKKKLIEFILHHLKSNETSLLKIIHSIYI